MMKSLVRLLEEDVGFRTEHLLTNDDFEAWVSKGSIGKPNRAGRKRNQIEFRSQVETFVEFLPRPRRCGSQNRVPLRPMSRVEVWRGGRWLAWT
jgi:hypothetical protein